MGNVIILSIAILLLKDFILKTAERFYFARYSIPEVTFLAFRYKVLIQSDPNIANINAIITDNVIRLSYDACFAAARELKALILHEIGHLHYKTNCEIMADTLRLANNRETAFAFICLTKRVLNQEPQNMEMRSRAIRAVKYYQRTYKNIPLNSKAS